MLLHDPGALQRMRETLSTAVSADGAERLASLVEAVGGKGK